MRQIRPTIDELKKRYSSAMAVRPALATGPLVSDDGIPMLPHPPRSLAECMRISDEVGRMKVRRRERLPVCDAAEAGALLERFLDPEVLGCALDNPDAEVRAMALTHLHEFEAGGDPYSRDILAAWRRRNPPPGM